MRRLWCHVDRTVNDAVRPNTENGDEFESTMIDAVTEHVGTWQEVAGGGCAGHREEGIKRN